MKKTLYVLIALVGITIGIIGSYKSMMIPLAVAAVFIFVVAALSNYQITTYLVAFYVIFDYIFRNILKVPGLSSVWEELLLLALIIMWGYKWIVFHKESSFRRTPMDLPLLLFFGIGFILLIVNSQYFSVSVDGLRAIIEYMFFYFLVMQLIKDENGARHLCILLLIIGTGLAIHGIMQYLMHVPTPSSWTDQAERNSSTRAFSIVGSPNILGSLMVLLAPIAFSMFFAYKDFFKKILFGGAGLLMTLCLLLTLSRGAWAGFVIAIIILVLYKDKRLIIPVIVLGIVVVTMVPAISERITFMFSSDYIQSSLRGGRLSRWIIGWDLFIKNPIFGVGLGNFGGAVAMNHKDLFPNTFYMDNYFLKTLVETGLTGFIAFCLLIYNLIAWSIRAIAKMGTGFNGLLCQGIFAGLCGVIFHNFGENVFEQPLMITYFWLLAGILMYFNYRSIPATEVPSSSSNS